MQTSTAQPPQQPAKHSQAVLRKLVTGVPAPAAAGGAARSARWVSDEVATKQVKSQPDLRTSAQSGSVRERAKQYEQRCVSSSSNDGPSLRSRPPKQQAVSKAVAADDGKRTSEFKHLQPQPFGLTSGNKENAFQVRTAAASSSSGIPFSTPRNQYSLPKGAAPPAFSPPLSPAGKATANPLQQAYGITAPTSMNGPRPNAVRASAFRSGRETPAVQHSAVKTVHSIRNIHSTILANAETTSDMPMECENAVVSQRCLQVKPSSAVTASPQMAAQPPLSTHQHGGVTTLAGSSSPVFESSTKAGQAVSSFPAATLARPERGSDYAGQPTSASAPTVPGRQPRQRAATAGPSDHPAHVEVAFEALITNMHLSDSLARKMLALDLRVKSDMLKGTAKSGGIAHHTVSSTSSAFTRQAVGAMEIPAFDNAISKRKMYGSQGSTGDAPRSPKKRPAVIRKVKSFIRSSPEVSPSLPDGFQLVHDSRTFPSPSLRATASGFSTVPLDLISAQIAAGFASMLQTRSVRNLDADRDMKKLRVLLRNESSAWIAEWARCGGYDGLLERLHEMLTMEWREEQHDDRILMELLKCFRGLLMTDVGRTCLASHSPTPFRPLVELLYSDKKPGDLISRQCIIEILLGVFLVFPREAPQLSKDDWCKPWSSNDAFGTVVRPSVDTDVSSSTPVLRPEDIETHGSNASSAVFPSDLTFLSKRIQSQSVEADPNTMIVSSAHDLVRSLLIGPPNEKEETTIHFVQQAHKLRPFKLWMDEIAGILSDYFWIFCHSSNTFWRLEGVNEEQVEQPKVPGGMTGGVEYEAMEYCVSHLRLLNQVARSCRSNEAAYNFHKDLFDCRFAAVLLTLRKTSTEYYPYIHLELARYISLCLSSGFPLPTEVRKHVASAKSDIVGQARPANQPSHRRTRTDLH